MDGATADSLSSPKLEFSYSSASKCIPDSLYNHVAWLVTNSDPEVDKSGRVLLDKPTHEKVLNLSQDIAAQVSNIPTPKQVGLALHILKETRSKRTVTMLNRFGNTISYDDAQRYITTVAQSVEEQTEQDGFFTPINLEAGRFTHCAIDNLDFHEHTIDGTTLHATTIIFYQYVGEYDNSEQTKVQLPINKGRNKSLKVSSKFHPKETFLSSKDREKSRDLTNITMVPAEEEQVEDVTSSNNVWHMLRMGVTDLVNSESNEFISPTCSAYNALILPSKAKPTII